MLFGKKKKYITFLIGSLWYYIKSIESMDKVAEATDIIKDVCKELKIDWNQVMDAEKTYQIWDAFQSGCL